MLLPPLITAAGTVYKKYILKTNWTLSQNQNNPILPEYILKNRWIYIKKLLFHRIKILPESTQSSGKLSVDHHGIGTGGRESRIYKKTKVLTKPFTQNLRRTIYSQSHLHRIYKKNNVLTNPFTQSIYVLRPIRVKNHLSTMLQSPFTSVHNEPGNVVIPWLMYFWNRKQRKLK